MKKPFKVVVIVFFILLQLRSEASILSPIKSVEKIDTVYFKLTEGLNPNLSDGLKGKYDILKDPNLNLGFYTGGIWLKFKVPKDRTNKLLAFENPILDLGLIYTKEDDSLKLIETLGDQIPFSKRGLQHRFPLLDLKKINTKCDSLWVFIANNGEQFALPIIVWQKNDFQLFNQYEYPFWGSYFGIIIFAILFNLFIAIVLKEKNIFAYVAYLLCLLFLQSSLSGFSLIWFWGDNLWLVERANLCFASLSIFFLLNFTLGFLSVKHFLPRAYKFIHYSRILVALNVVLSLCFPSNWIKPLIIFINAITFIFGLVIIPTAYLIYKNHFKEARYFLLAFLLLIFGVFAFVLKNLGILPSNFITVNGLQIGSSLEVILLTFAIIDKFKAYREQSINRLKEINSLKTEANIKLEEKVKERTIDLEKSNNQLREQKDIIEEKNQEITESIFYGKKIQKAILPNIEELNKFDKKAFVLFKPKDIVSGDFYWVSHKKDFSFYIVADCTGHGVPGAFMSMIGNTLLNQIINKESINEPHKILNKLRDEIILALNQSPGLSEHKDGMDMALVRIDHRDNKMVFAGANNPVYIVSSRNIENLEVDLDETDKKLYSIKANKQPIGLYMDEKISFTSHEVQLEKGDIIYMFTDGYPDQFGGPKGKKFLYKRFKKTFLNISTLPVEEQQTKLNLEIEKWMSTKNNLNEAIFQVDDICIMGLKI